MNTLTNSIEYLDINETVSILGVSSATIRNWIKYNYITPKETPNKKLVFHSNQIRELKERIASGEVNRLNKRANKKNSCNTFIPDEYADNQEVIKLVQEILENHKINKLQIDKVLLVLAINLLKNNNLVNYKKLSNLAELDYKNEIIKNEINWWLEKIEDKTIDKNYAELLSITIPKITDILGLVYQSLSTEGSKAEGGSYYTPKKVVDEIIDNYVEKNHTVLDPCCGTGQFILSIARKVKDPTKIWGFDIDEKAVRLARLNLILHFSNVDFEPHIYHKNTLTEINSSGLFSENNIPMFDVIATNPPWGVHFSKSETYELQNLFPVIKSGEAFSYFIYKGLELLKENGILSFILPESILNIKTHRDIREVLVNKTTVKKVKYLNRVFKNVFTPVIRLDVINKKPHFTNKIKAEKDGSTYEIEQTRIQNNPDRILNVFTDTADISLFDKTYEIPHTTLKDKAEWALGVVTGDNKKHLSDKKTKTNEPILTGKDIKKFTAISASNFIEFNPDNFQQVAPEYKYRAKEKLIYKFISKELVFSYDDKQTLTLNSANILIPKVDNYPIKTILALFNSSLYQLLYQKKFGAIKILKGDIEQLPLPIIDKGKHKDIERIVNKLLDNTKPTENRKRVYLELDDYIMNLFSLKKEEKDYIRKSIKVSDKLLNNI
ncbi:MAG: N-6 DNA methylase [Candidatus Paceibacterota bacterium]|jgi:predicted RNA methylase/predicted site-specific integrase-resolvase